MSGRRQTRSNNNNNNHSRRRGLKQRDGGTCDTSFTYIKNETPKVSLADNMSLIIIPERNVVV